MRSLLLLPFLAGCTPFLRADVGYSFENADYGLVDETGALANVELGLKKKHRWGISYCSARHTSFLVNSPEIVLNTANCGFELEFGANKTTSP